MKKIKTGFMFIWLLLALAIIMFIIFRVLKLYLKNPSIKQETQEVMSESDIDTTNYQSTIDNARNRIEDIQDKHLDELNKLEEN
jgi:hypothetical protein